MHAHNTMAKRLRCVNQSVINYVVNHVQLFPSAQWIFLLQFTLNLLQEKAFTSLS